VWVVDPVDGTTNLAAGLPLVTSSIALARHGVVQVVEGLFHCACFMILCLSDTQHQSGLSVLTSFLLLFFARSLPRWQLGFSRWEWCTTQVETSASLPSKAGVLSSMERGLVGVMLVVAMAPRTTAAATCWSCHQNRRHLLFPFLLQWPSRMLWCALGLPHFRQPFIAICA
jgi:hypothetical protein